MQKHFYQLIYKYLIKQKILSHLKKDKTEFRFNTIIINVLEIKKK